MASTATKVLGTAAAIGALFLGKTLWPRGRQALEAIRNPTAAAFLVEADKQGVRQRLEARLQPAKTPEEATQIVMKLALHGLSRLPPDELAERASLLAYLDRQAGDTLCARRFMGTLQPAMVTQYLSFFDAPRRERWVALTVSAVKAELLADEPIELVTPGEFRATFASLASAATPGESYRLSGVLDDLDHAGVEDQCWVSTTITRLALAQAEPERSHSLLILARLEASSREKPE